MSQFKVGDRVVRTKFLEQSPPSWPSFEEGKVYTVKAVSADGGWLDIEGMPQRCMPNPYFPRYFRLANYSEYFTEQQAKTPLLLGHVADSPIQKHSVGDFYPLAVVGYGQGEKVIYVVENLKDQTVCGGTGIVRQWYDAADAQRFLERVAKGANDFVSPVVWNKARPVFGKSGILVLPEAPAKRTRVIFEKQDDIIAINGAYYKALEQDIG